MLSENSYVWFQTELRNAYKKSGCKTLKEFAETSKISEAHLNRILNNSKVSQPTVETLKKIITASPEANAVSLFESCGYDRKICRKVIQDIRKNMGISERINTVENEIMSTCMDLIDRPCIFYDSAYEISRTIKHDVAELFGVKLLQEIPDVTSHGETAICCTAIWSIDNDEKTYYSCETLFVIYAIPVEHNGEYNGYLPTRFAMSGLELKELGVIPDKMIEFYENADTPIELNHAITLYTLHEKDTSTGTDYLLDAIFKRKRTDDLTYVMMLDFGIGTEWTKIPSNYKNYILKNKNLIEERFHCTDELEKLEKMGNPTENEIYALFNENNGQYPNKCIRIVLAILNQKMETAGLNCDVRYSAPDDLTDQLMPVIYVSEDQFSAYCEYDTELKNKIERVLIQEFKEIGFENYGPIYTYTEHDIRNDELRSGLQPINEVEVP